MKRGGPIPETVDEYLAPVGDTYWVQSQSTSNPAAVSQWASVEALNEFHGQMTKHGKRLILARAWADRGANARFRADALPGPLR